MVICLDWKYYDGKYYKLFPTEETLSDARSNCIIAGGDLAQVSSNAENNFIKSLELTIRAWIGGSENAIDGSDWKWKEGTPFGFTKWNSGEGTEGGRISFGKYGHWNDEAGSALLNSICKRA